MRLDVLLVNIVSIVVKRMNWITIVKPIDFVSSHEVWKQRSRRKMFLHLFHVEGLLNLNSVSILDKEIYFALDLHEYNLGTLKSNAIFWVALIVVFKITHYFIIVSCENSYNVYKANDSFRWRDRWVMLLEWF